MIWPFVRSLLKDAEALAFPPRCHFCDDEYGEDGQPESFCPKCRIALVRDAYESCPRCSSTVGPYTDTAAGCPKCRDQSFAFDRIIRLGPYGHELREAILRMKHRAGEGMAEAIGRLLAMRPDLASLRPDAVVPVPLHWTRRIVRGFNQAEAIACGVAGGLGVPCRARWLRRVRRTPTGGHFSRSQRLERTRNAFAVRSSCQALRILLIDDVVTTGATANEAAKVLVAAGAAQVTVACVAHDSSAGR
jgi:ComF family protein